MHHTNPVPNGTAINNEMYTNPIINGTMSTIHEHPNILIANDLLYMIGGKLGVGAFGKVCDAVRVSDGAAVAIKFVKKDRILDWKEKKGRFLPTEIYLLEKVKAMNNVINLLDHYERSDDWVMIFHKPESCMDLFQWLKTRGSFDEPVARRYFIQITESLLECGSLGVLHRDIKAENVLLDLSENAAKLIDFGYGAVFHDGKYYGDCGTRLYNPPELIRHGWYYGEPLQVWTLGILLCEMVMGLHPFSSEDEIVRGELKFDDWVSYPCRDLIQLCLSQDYTRRPSYRGILEHPWITGPNGLSQRNTALVYAAYQPVFA